MEVFRLSFEIKNNFLCESPFQILLTNLNLNLKGFSMPTVPKCDVYQHQDNLPMTTTNASEKVKDNYTIAVIQKYKFTRCWARENAVLIWPAPRALVIAFKLYNDVKPIER